jgi:hypothetical protein
MTWLRTDAPGVAPDATPLDRAFGHRPDAYARFRELLDGLAAGGVDAATLAACRVRIDALLRFEPDPTGALALTAAQRAAVGYAEQYALDPHQLRDTDFDALHEHYDDAQLATLTLAVAMYDALARFTAALEI